MTDVVRLDREFQEVIYTVGADALRRAVLGYLYDEHLGSFTDETTVEFRDDGSVVVATRFASVDRSPEGQDAEERLDAKRESAVAESETPND